MYVYGCVYGCVCMGINFRSKISMLRDTTVLCGWQCIVPYDSHLYHHVSRARGWYSVILVLKILPLLYSICLLWPFTYLLWRDSNSRPENTHHWGEYGLSPVLQAWIRLLLYIQNHIFSLLVKSSLFKLETSCTVILLPMVSVLCHDLTDLRQKRYHYTMVPNGVIVLL